MARAVVTSNPQRRPAFEPLYAFDAHSGATIEVFHCDRVLAQSFGTRGVGWLHWSCHRGCLPHTRPHGPFPTSYGAFRDALTRGDNSAQFGRRITTCSTKP
jgi:hypothetical protein